MTQADLQSFLSNRESLSRTTTLVREAGLRTLLLHLKAGEHIPEHQTRGAIIVQCLEGSGTFVAAEERIELRPGALFSLAPAVPHSVVAATGEDVLLLVTVAEQNAAAS